MSYLEIYKKYVTEDEFKSSSYFAAVKAGEMSEEDAYVRLLCRKEWAYGREIERGEMKESSAATDMWYQIYRSGEAVLIISKGEDDIEKKFEKMWQDYKERENEKEQEVKKMKKRRKDAIPISAVLFLTIPFLFELVTFHSVLPMGLYGNVPAVVIFWFPIAGIIDYYYKKKIGKLETGLKLLQQEKPRMSIQKQKEMDALWEYGIKLKNQWVSEN